MGGSTAIPWACRTRWVSSGLAHGVCMTCTGMCGSGARTDTTRITMRNRRRTIRAVLRGALPARLAAVAGASSPGTAGRRYATGARLGACVTTWASASPEFWRASKASERSRCVARSAVPPPLPPQSPPKHPAANGVDLGVGALGRRGDEVERWCGKWRRSSIRFG